MISTYTNIVYMHYSTGISQGNCDSCDSILREKA